MNDGLLPDDSRARRQRAKQVIVTMDGCVVELQRSGRDVSERKQKDDAVGDSDTRNRAILRALPDMLFLLSPDGIFLDYHAQNPHRLFASPDAFLGRKIGDVMPPDLAAMFSRAISEVLLWHKPVVVDYPLLIENETQYFEARLVWTDDGKILSVVRDLSGQRRAEMALRDKEAALRVSYQYIRDLGGRLIAAQEEERRHIARELHDDLSQKLALLNFDIEQLADGVDSLPQALSARVRHLSSLAGEIATDMDHLAHRLHPSKLEALGLVPAVAGYCREFSTQYDVSVEFVNENVPVTVPSDSALCLFRIVQEGLRNVVKHSGVKNATVRLAARERHLLLQVADLGQGFSPTSKGLEGLGLISMRERVHFLGGEIVIDSESGRGTRIDVRLPFSAAFDARLVEARTAGDLPQVVASSTKSDLAWTGFRGAAG